VRPRIEKVVQAAGLKLAHPIEINSIAILKSALQADIGATILPVAPVLNEIERGVLRSYSLAGATISRTVCLCASRNIPLTNAAAAVKRLVFEVTGKLHDGGQWQGVRPLG
jgi:LysR family nitrogen assimilation transcriptional regulator